MADELLRYVSDQLKKGYSPAQIKQTLLRNGYSPALVDGVMDSVALNQPNTTIPSRPLSNPINMKLLVGVAAAILILAAAFASLFLLKPNEALLDLRSTPDYDNYHAGDTVGFDLEIFNMGSKERFDITLSYRVLDADDNLVMSKEETAAISTSTSYHKEIVLPTSMKKGIYSVKIFANYDNKVATSGFTVNIDPKTPSHTSGTGSQGTSTGSTGGSSTGTGSQTGTTSGSGTATTGTKTPTCTDGIKNQAELGPDCAGPCNGYWYDLSCHDNTKPATNTVKSTGTLLLEARLLAKTDPDSAKDTCLEFSDEHNRDACLKSVAQASMRSDYCELVISDNDRDLCYYPFFMKGDYTICEKLVLKESLETCSQLKQLSDISKATQQQPVQQSSQTQPQPVEETTTPPQSQDTSVIQPEEIPQE